MKKLVFALVLGLSACAATGRAQDADPLAVTLPNGRVVHFQTEEQKARFVAAQARLHATAAAAPAPAEPPKMASSTVGHSSSDQEPKKSGVVNVAAPTFTADYYLGMAPDSWVGKQLVLSVAYVRPHDEQDPAAVRKDGMRALYAYTWGNIAAGSDQRSGGGMTILAPPDVAARLIQSCGTSLLWMSSGRYRTMLIKGEVTTQNISAGEHYESTKYALVVAK